MPARPRRSLGADYAGVDLLRAADGRDYVLELNGIPGWRGLQRGHGRRRGGGAGRSTSRRASARARPAPARRSTPPWSAVATSAPAATALRQRAQVGHVADAPAGKQCEPPGSGVELANESTSGPSPPPTRASRARSPRPAPGG